ncbi:hypothetical protein [Vibrio parahaemolyticus]|uniref:hypothetical protein n=1 Tax=Vibrio parahaemolyticus TaxID=670 RepID=UPI00226A5F01|nr:hypothetical protein [Vibrio parahaemolyticus]MCX8796166.1 hypothetical protein [Vibrio parahaemolyticus]
MTYQISEDTVRERVSRWVLNFHFGEDVEKLNDRDKERYNDFISAYEMSDLSDLNENMIQLLSYMFWEDSANTDHLSFALGRSRRATINTANALVRRGFLYWDIPTASNMDDGYDLTIDRSKKKPNER